MKKVLAVFMSVLMFAGMGCMASASGHNHSNKNKHKKPNHYCVAKQRKSSPKKVTKPAQSNNTDEFPVASIYNPEMIRSKTVVEDKNDKESPTTADRNSKARKCSSLYSRISLSPAVNTEEARSPREITDNLNSISEDFALISSSKDSAFFESGLDRSVMGSQNQSTK